MTTEATLYKRRRRSQRYTQTYKNSRKIFRSVAFGLWAAAAIIATYRSYVLDINNEIQENSRSRRSAEISENSTCSEFDKELNFEDYHTCLYEEVWGPECGGQYISEESSISAFLDKHEDDFSPNGLNMETWLNINGNPEGYEKSDPELLALCCIGGQRKHALHNGPIDEFPKINMFTHSQIKAGYWIVHLLVSLYMFAALAIVCDDYFVPALERLSEELQLSEDVAGATFMAAGSSAPELFTSVIGVFVAKSDIGIGTIVGSAVFNILVIIGACGLFVKGDIHLSWWPLFRDSMFYLFTIICLLFVIYPSFDDAACPKDAWENTGSAPEDYNCVKQTLNDLLLDPETFKSNCQCSTFSGLTTKDLLFGENQKYGRSEVTLTEAIVMLVMYTLYIVVMKYNQELEGKVAGMLGYEDEEKDAEAGENLKLRLGF